MVTSSTKNSKKNITLSKNVEDTIPEAFDRVPEDLQLSSYDYDLPLESIAQHPSERRDESRLLVVDRNGETESRIFREILEMLPSGALLVMNDTRVMPARLYAQKESGGRVELLRIHDPSLPSNQARFLCKGARLKQPGVRLLFAQGSAELICRDTDGTLILSPEEGTNWETVHQHEGELPLPPYIERPDGPSIDDQTRYQTVFAQQAGAVAAPTAGLHFTKPLLESLRSRGISTSFITLHVGPGTFQPVRAEDVRQHQIRPEWAQLTAETAEQIRLAKSEGRPVIAVGTTVVRTLEGAAARHTDLQTLGASFHPEDLVILPGHKFLIVDGMITNFHLPKSSLMLLVSAMVGRNNLMNAYEQALTKGYRFYSYGDAMFIPPSLPISKS